MGPRRLHGHMLGCPPFGPFDLGYTICTDIYIYYIQFTLVFLAFLYAEDGIWAGQPDSIFHIRNFFTLLFF